MKKPKQWCFPPKFICVFFYLHEVDSTREQLQTKQTPNNDRIIVRIHINLQISCLIDIS